MILDLFEVINFTPQEKVVVEYIKQYPDCIIHYNAQELSKLMYVSPPTIARFVKKLGFNGFLDFKLAYVQEHLHLARKESLLLNKESRIEDVIEFLPQAYAEIIQETKLLIKKESFVRCINYMFQAKQIDFYANDNNYIQIQSACLRLNAIGIRAQAFNTLNHLYIETLKSQDTLAFVVSHSGKNKTMVETAYHLRKKRVRVIAITGNLDPTLELVCNESLYIVSKTKMLQRDTISYNLSLNYILDILVMSMTLKKVNG